METVDTFQQHISAYADEHNVKRLQYTQKTITASDISITTDTHTRQKKRGHYLTTIEYHVYLMVYIHKKTSTTPETERCTSITSSSIVESNV